MPVIKPISGHTSAVGIQRYLERGGRALAADYINIDPPTVGAVHGTPTHAECEWANQMDSTRREFGNDAPWRGRRARTYKHYVLSPDPEDGISLDDLRGLAVDWAWRHFSDFEVAIVYHDDNERGIPHAHVVVNNTNLATGRRLQDPDPGALNRSLQSLADRRGLRHFENTEERPHAARAFGRERPATLQAEHATRAEAELSAKGEYSWVADIRCRVRVARAVATSEAEFRSALSAMGIAVSDNSPKAAKRDWVYALEERPSRRVSGEKLGLSYGRERLLSSFAAGTNTRLSDVGRAELARIAERAVEVGDVSELREFSEVVSFIDRQRIRSVEDLHRLAESNDARAAALVERVERAGILPEKAPKFEARVPISRREQSTHQGTRSTSDRGKQKRRARDAASHQQQRRQAEERGYQR